MMIAIEKVAVLFDLNLKNSDASRSRLNLGSLSE